MLSWKFKTLIFLLVSLNAFAFSDMQCLNGNFSAVITHKGMPFGLTQNILEMRKDACIITVKHEKLRFMKSYWEIDVCRGPVHIKKMSSGSTEVLKRASGCEVDSSTEYCEQVSKIKKIIQDDGLIFAPGEKEELSSDHGKMYCAFLLLRHYLDNAEIFSRKKTYSNFLEAKKEIKKEEVVQEEAPVSEEAETDSFKNGSSSSF